MVRSLRFVTLTALAGVVAFGTGCPEPLMPMDSGRDARADTTDARANETGNDTGADSVDVAADNVTPDVVMTDTTMVDAVTDTGVDAVTDTGTDVRMDAMGTDAGMDVARVDVATDTPVDAPTGPSAQIARARAAADGAQTTPIAIDGVTVTYVLPAFGADPPGFFEQASMKGHALIVAVHPATHKPTPAVGDVVSFAVTTIATAGSLREATAISGYARSATGTSVSPLRQDLTGATDLVTGLNNYDSELTHVDVTIAGAFGTAGAMHSSAPITTTGVPAVDANLRLRVTDTLRASLDLVQGCVVAVDGPLWRFNAQAQVSGWVTGDITVNSCPAPRLTTAAAMSGTSVVLTFDRTIDPASVMANGSQFTIAGPAATALAVSAATVSGRTVTLTTAMQTLGTMYTVTAAGTVTDTTGAALDPAARTAMFTGFSTPAIVRINEVNANIGSGCDLIELRVVQGGSMNGFLLRERDTGSLATFTNFNVQTNDFIVVHMGGTVPACNPTNAVSETTAPNQFPAATATGNYDTAYDIWSADAGLTNTDNVFTLFDGTMTIVDAILVADSATAATAAAASETAAATVANAGQWTMVGGGVPPGGFVDMDFRMNAVLDLNATGMMSTGTSIQRINNADTQTLADWNDTSIATWGANNPGQTNF